MRITKLLFISLVSIISTCVICLADVRLPSVIADNMVLQQNMKVPIWGWAETGEKIEVKGSWQSSSKTVKADDQGKWQVKIKTPKASAEQLELTIKGKNTLVLKNIMVGEVWLCSGQSNMQWPVHSSDNRKEEIASSNFPGIRIFVVEQSTSLTPLSDCNGKWLVCGPKTISDFSAVGYFFGRELHNELKVPVGLIGSYWGGTPAESWTKNQVLKSDPDLKPILDRFDHREAEIAAAKIEYDVTISKWQRAVAKAEKANRKVPKKPIEPIIMRSQTWPSTLYNAMISPLIPYGIRGAIWYQGEANVDRAYQYRMLFPAMIKNWRSDWAQGDFPFYYVQIAPFAYETQSVGKKEQGTAAELREAQLMTLSVPNTGMAVTMDIGNTENIHPTNKQEVGRRLSLWAMAKIYGKKDLVYSGPIYKSMKIKGDNIRLTFDNIGSGLMAKDGELNEFTIAGEDKVFVSAKAAIDGKTIVVSSDKVAKPVAVRFAWENASVPNLFNKEGLPASSFRTDDWPGVTSKRK